MQHFILIIGLILVTLVLLCGITNKFERLRRHTCWNCWRKNWGFLMIRGETMDADGSKTDWFCSQDCLKKSNSAI